MTTDKKFNSEYYKIINYFIKNNNLYVDKIYNLYSLIIKKCQINFDKIKNNLYLNNLENDKTDINYYFKEKNIILENMKLISYLYNDNLIDDNILNYIIDILLIIMI